MTPEDHLRALWAIAHEALLEHHEGAAFYRAHPKYSTVSYKRLDRANSLEGGNYSWNDGGPTILLYRAVEPPDVNRPDLSQPLKDLFLIAHELGHYDSDRTGERSQSSFTRLKGATSLGDEDARIIISEEHSAWCHARRRLEKLGFSNWPAFDATVEEFFGGYVQGVARLRGLEPAAVRSWVLPNAK